jgi:hypothetical protein
MKHDMMKLICERERIGHTSPSLKTGKRLDPNLDYSDDFDSGPSRLSTSRKKAYGYKCKELNENLNPLERFLETAVGRLWDDVYSEIRANIDVRKAIGLHVMTHLWHFVERNVEMLDGIPYETKGGYNRVYEANGLYVHPETGILCRHEAAYRRRVRHIPPVDSLHWYGDIYFKLEVLSAPPSCGCVHYKLESGWKIEPYVYTPDRNAVCIHGNRPLPRPIWFLIEYAYHRPDEVYQVFKYGDWQAKQYGVIEPEQTRIVYYRDVPDKMAEAFVVKKKVANKKELKLIHKAIESGEGRS